MSALLPTFRRGRGRRWAIGRALLALSLACAAVVAALHGHRCTGDDCVCCLVVHGAQAVLCLSCGATLALPLVTSVGAVPRGIVVRPVRQVACVLAATSVCLVAETPVSRQVKLLI